VFQVRKCKWVRVGSSDKIPGPVKNAFAGRGQAISRIAKEESAALLGTALIWESVTGESIELDIVAAKQFPMGAIAHDDLEDIVALYLQIEMGWHIVPSTAKKTTRDIEFVLRNSMGQRAYLQVKSGQATVEVTKIDVPQDVDFFFIFYPTISEQDSFGTNSKIVLLNPNEIAKFLSSHKTIMPPFVQLLLR
jgi:hypothetical protein